MSTKAWAKCACFCIAVDLHLLIIKLCRFIHSPINTVDKRLSSETTTLKSDITGLEKRLDYLEMTHQKSKEGIEQIFSRASA